MARHSRKNLRYNPNVVAGTQIEGLLRDLETITDIARAGVISRRDEVLEPGETRPAAILFVDLVGFTSLSLKLSSEVLTKVVDRMFRIFELTVRAQGGYCDKVMGDAALYVFAGHPNYPPVCEAALKASLKLQGRLGQINESLGDTEVRLAIRQGVAFGEVTRQAVGAEHAQLTVMGDTVNQAQRLQAAALPDTILTTIRVLEKAGDAFARNKMGKLELKGIGEVTTYLVTGMLEQTVQLRGAFRQLTPLIGRETELEQAVTHIRIWLQTTYPRETWDITETSAPLAGRNRLMVLHGVPAAGKSRLAYEIAKRLKSEVSAVIATAHCAENAMLAQFTAELAGVAGLTADNLPQRWEELCANSAQIVSPEYAERQRQHLRLLAYVLGCKAINSCSIGQADPMSFAVSCQLAIRSCCELVAHEGKPVLLIVEDLQWLSEFTDVMADVFARACLPQPLIVIGTARPEYTCDLNVLNEGESCNIELGLLSREQGDLLVQALLPGLTIPEAVSNEIHDKAAGIPYFYEDFVRMLVRQGLVKQVDGLWQLAGNLIELDIPSDLQTLMLGRLDQLNTEVRDLARRASVLGRSFYRSLLLAIEQRLGFDHEGHPDDDLSNLINEKLLVAESSERYFFEHVLLRQAVYSSLLSTNRRLLHRLAAEILLMMHVPGGAGELELLVQLVDHLEACGQYSIAHERACDALNLMALIGRYAAWDATVSCAVRVWQMQHSLSNLSALPCKPADYPNSPALHLALGIKRWQQGDYALAYEHALLAHSLASLCDDRHGVGMSLIGLGILHRAQGRLEKARSCFDEALTILRALDDRRGEGIALGYLGRLHRQQGQLEKARTYFEESLTISSALNDRLSRGFTLNSLGTLFRMHGQIEKSQACFDEALAIRRELGDRRGEGTTLIGLGVLHFAQRRLDEAWEYFEKSLIIRRELGDSHGEAYMLYDLGWYFAAKGNLEQAIVKQREAIAASKVLGIRKLHGSSLSHLGRLLAWQGSFVEALEALNQGVHVLSTLSDILQLGLSYCSWVHYYLATAGFIPQTLRQSNGQGEHGCQIEPISAPASALIAARQALSTAVECQQLVNAGPFSILGQDIAMATDSILNFEYEQGLEEQCTSSSTV